MLKSVDNYWLDELYLRETLIKIIEPLRILRPSLQFQKLLSRDLGNQAQVLGFQIWFPSPYILPQTIFEHALC